MRANKLVLVEVRGVVVRIFKTHRAAMESSAPSVWMRYGEAVGSIRHSCFVRSGGDCEQCGDTITEKCSHMHERLFRGRGGEISLENSGLICARCHKYDHRGRNPQWKKEEIIVA